MNLEWNVYYEDFNSKTIKPLNVFQHYTFRDDVVETMTKAIERDTFDKEIKRSAQYHFWSKSEYEVVITSWPPYITEEERNRINIEGDREVAQMCTPKRYNARLVVGKKISIYDQLMMNWDKFIDYLWNNKSN